MNQHCRGFIAGRHENGVTSQSTNIKRNMNYAGMVPINHNIQPSFHSNDSTSRDHEVVHSMNTGHIPPMYNYAFNTTYPGGSLGHFNIPFAQSGHTHTIQPFQHNSIPAGFSCYLPGSNITGISSPHSTASSFHAQSDKGSHLPETGDTLLLKQWLKQNFDANTTEKQSDKQLKISEAKKLFGRYLKLNDQLKQLHEKLHTNIDCTNEKWSVLMSDVQDIMNEIRSIENILNDSDFVEDLLGKIQKRKEKRRWWKSRQQRRYLQRQEDDGRRQKLHHSIDVWQTEILYKDIHARNAASLKNEAGGVLGEVRRKLQDCNKIKDVLESLVKLRELRHNEGQRKGVYPKTSTTQHESFQSQYNRIEKMLMERIAVYEEEERTLQVMIIEEEDERKLMEKQERLEQKALLNLSREEDYVTEFRRYYEQADESIENLIQIRREWDLYLTPHASLGSRLPCDPVTPVAPTSSQWETCLKSNG